MPLPPPQESIPLRDASFSPPTSPREYSSRPRHQSQLPSYSHQSSASRPTYPPARSSQEGSRNQSQRGSYYAGESVGFYRDEAEEATPRPLRGARDKYAEDDEDGYGAPEGEGNEEDWDVYADFNNAGPRYSARPHLGPGIEGERFVANARNSRSSRAMSTYSSTPSVYGGIPVGRGQPINSGGLNRSSVAGSTHAYDSNASLLGARGMYPQDKKGGGGSNMSDAQRQISELVTVPVLGADWKKSELHDLSRKGRREERAARRANKWKAFVRDEDRDRCCGRFSLRIVLVWAGFATVIATALLVYFLIPRVPSFAFATKQPFQPIEGATNTSDYISFSRTPANFDFNTTLSLQADTGSTYIPVHMSAVDARVFFIDSNKKVGSGHWEGTMPAKELYNFKMPIHFQYSAINSSDTTWAKFYDACQHIWTGTTRSSLKLRLELDLKATGRIGTSHASTQVSDIDCPYELPSNSA